jgi:tetratricopeptide (TPR) repeat protein
MSIILKALKRAEASRPEKKVLYVSTFSGGVKKIWGMLSVVLFASSLGFLTAVYLMHDNTDTKPQFEEKPVPMPDKVNPVSKPDASGLYNEAIMHIKGERYAQAEKLLRNALSIEPENAGFYNRLGFVLRKQEKYKEAISAYRKAILLKPDYYEAMNNLAVALEAIGQENKAEDIYKKILLKKPSIAEVHLNYALLLESQGRKEEAISHYHTFLNLSQDAELKEFVRKRLK